MMLNTSNKFIFATQPLKIWQVWRDAFLLAKKSFSKIWYLALMPSFFIIFNLFISLSDFFAFENKNLLYKILSSAPTYSAPLSILFFIIYFIIWCLFFAIPLYVIIYRMYSITSKARGLKDCIIHVAKRLGWLALGWLIIFGASAVIVLTFGIFISVMHHSIFLVVASFIGLIVGSCALLFYTIFFNIFILLENYRAWQAIKASYRLVKNHFWRTFFIIGFPLLLLSVILALPLILSFPASDLMNSSVQNIPHFVILYSIIDSLYRFIHFIGFPAITLVQLNDLKNRN